ncbi:MAG: hypothetical protein ABR508_11460, partial [Candidatus Baltobacteraceae bacterium]
MPLEALIERVQQVGGPAYALLVLRLRGFEREAWLRGKSAARRLERKTAAAFSRGCARVLREGDCIGHDPASELFVIALLAPALVPLGPIAGVVLQEAPPPAAGGHGAVLGRVADEAQRRAAVVG